jgi:hypothetical protein
MAMFTLEALPAKHGDSLLLHYGDDRLIVIDGGPSGVYNTWLRPRLKAIRDKRSLAEDKPLDIELMMVSHIDADHITGILELVTDMAEAKEAGNPLPYKIRRFWHNAFEDTVAKLAGGAGNAADAFSAGTDVLASSMTVDPASVAQGRKLMKLLPAVGLDGNKPFKGLVMYGKKKDPVKIGDLKLTVIGPNEDNLALLREDWAKKVIPILEKEEQQAAAAAVLDKSPYNLSSIVVLAELDGKTMLLTGDGRGDHTLLELEKAGLLADGPLEVDILKLPHHGSIRNATEEYLTKIRAKHYVISADGRHDNPDLATMKLLSAARPDDDFVVHITNPLEEFVIPHVGVELQEFFDAEKAAGRKYEVRIRKPGEKSISVAL